MGATPLVLINNTDNDLQVARESLYGILKAAFGFFAADLCVCMPVKITEICDRKTRQLMVQPLVKKLVRDTASFESRKPFAVKALQLASSRFVIDLPLKEGDVGWVIAGDRDTTGAVATHEESDLTTTMTHRYEYGFFIPDYYGVLKDRAGTSVEDPYTGDEGRLVISTFDGKQKISLGQADITITSSSVTIDSKDVNIRSEGFVNIEAPTVAVDGNFMPKYGTTGTITNFNQATVTNGIITAIN